MITLEQNGPLENVLPLFTFNLVLLQTLEEFTGGLVQVRHLAPGPVEFTAILLRDAGWFHE
jgi:hypothetical protein